VVKSSGHINAVVMLLIMFVISTFHNVSAQNNRFYFTHINEDPENNHGRITCITKDHEGFIWYGTYNGLYRYDGYESKGFRYDNLDSTTIDDNLISSILVDSNGTLWIGTFNGLNSFNAETETFKRYNISGKRETGIPVLSITERKKGEIWCGTWGKGLLKIDSESTEPAYVNLSSFKELTRKSNHIKQVKSDSNGNLYVCTWGDGLIRYSPSGNSVSQLKHIPGSKNSLPNNYVFNILPIGNGKCIVACKSGIISEYSEKENTFTIIKNVTSLLQDINTEVTKLLIDKDDNLCIATYGEGIIVYNLNNGKIIRLKKKRNNIHSLSSNLVTDIYFSKDDNLTWAATINGINLRAPGTPKFKTYNYLCLTKPLSELNCQGFLYHLKNKICIATRTSGIWEFYPETETFRQKKFQRFPALSSNNILSLAHAKNIVVAGTDKGINIIYPKNKKTEKYNSSTKIKPSSDIIRCIIAEDDRHLWIGSTAGLEFFDLNKKKVTLFKPYPSMNTLSARNLVRALCKWGNNTLWVGTSTGGLNKFDISQKRFVERYTHKPGVNSISNNKINDIFIDSKEYIWLATGRGLNRFDTKNGTFRILGQDNGLTDENIFAVEEDNNGNIWFSTGKSIAKLDPETWKFIEYNKFDGVTASTFNTGSSLKLPSGKLLFGGVNGFNLFMPDNLKQNDYRPNIVITDIKILNLPIKDYEKENHISITDTAVNHIKVLKLKPFENSLSFKFAALNYVLPQKNQYKHILEGFDKKWINTGSNRTATYTNIPPGKYVFRVRATNNDKIWSTHEKRIVIIITPPFYNTLFFKIAVIVLLIALFFSYNKIKLIKIKQQKKHLEKVVKEKTGELILANKYLEEKQEEIEIQHARILSQKNELVKHKDNLEEIVKQRTQELENAKIKAEKSERLKSAFLANMSHEIRTPMNAIVGFSTLLNTPGLNDDERKEFIGHIKENSEALLMLIDDLLDLSQIEAGNMYVRKERFVVKELITQITKIYISKYGSRNIKLIYSFNNNMANKTINSDPDRLKQVLRNLLENAYKFTEKGSIEIGVDKYSENDKKYIMFFVKDSGIGIPADKLDEVFDRFRKLEMNTDKYYSGVGLGLSISKKIIENLDGRIWAESKEGEYSKFIFIIPAGIED